MVDEKTHRSEAGMIEGCGFFINSESSWDIYFRILSSCLIILYNLMQVITPTLCMPVVLLITVQQQRSNDVH